MPPFNVRRDSSALDVALRVHYCAERGYNLGIDIVTIRAQGQLGEGQLDLPNLRFLVGFLLFVVCHRLLTSFRGLAFLLPNTRISTRSRLTSDAETLYPEMGNGTGIVDHRLCITILQEGKSRTARALPGPVTMQTGKILADSP